MSISLLNTISGLETKSQNRVGSAFLYDDDEINIAVHIEITYRKRALQIGANEIGAQDILHAIYEIPQDNI